MLQTILDRRCRYSERNRFRVHHKRFHRLPLYKEIPSNQSRKCKYSARCRIHANRMTLYTPVHRTADLPIRYRLCIHRFLEQRTSRVSSMRWYKLVFGNPVRSTRLCMYMYPVQSKFCEIHRQTYKQETHRSLPPIHSHKCRY